MMTVAPDVFKVKIKNKLKQTPKVFYKKAILKIFSIFTGKDLCGGLFVTKKLQHRSFSVNITKSSRTTILKNLCKRLLLNKDSRTT